MFPVKWLMQDKYESWRYAPRSRVPTSVGGGRARRNYSSLASTEDLYARFAPGIASLQIIPGRWTQHDLGQLRCICRPCNIASESARACPKPPTMIQFTVPSLIHAKQEEGTDEFPSQHAPSAPSHPVGPAPAVAAPPASIARRILRFDASQGTARSRAWISWPNHAPKGSQALRKVLSFTLRHWAGHKPLVSLVAGGMMLATLTEVVVPVYRRPSGRRARARTRAFDDAVVAFAAMAALGLTMVGAAPRWRGAGIVPADAEHDAQHRAGRVSSRAALLHRLAQQQLRRLHRAQDHPRHVGARLLERRAAARVAAVAGRVGRHGGAARDIAGR